MNVTKKISLVSVLVLTSGFLLLTAPLARAVTPVLSVSATGDGDSVQVSVTGDASVSILIEYMKTGVGSTIVPLGTSDANGHFSTTISSLAYGIVTGASVDVVTGGINGTKSNTIVWPQVTATSTNASTFALSQTGLVLSVGQSSTVTASSSNSFYMLSNSNPAVVNVNINSNQITITANSSGQTAVTICQQGMSSNCPSVYVVVQNPGTQSLTFSQSSLTISSGQNFPLTISGGTGIYTVLNNSNPGVVLANISGSTLNVSTSSSSGSASLIVCSSDISSCGTVNVTVGTATANTSVYFSQSNPSVLVGQSTNVTISGPLNSTYYIASNSNPSTVFASISGNILALNGVAGGLSVITVCPSAGSCSALTVIVNASSTITGLSLSQTNASLLAGQSLNITISGGSMPYNLSSDANTANIFQGVINGNTLTLYGVNSGSALAQVCSSQGGCVPLNVTVGNTAPAATATTTSQPILSQNSVSLTLGQETAVSITGNGNYYVATNSNPNIASVLINQNSAIVTTVGVGTDNVSICQNSGQCVALSIVVGAATTTTTIPVPTPIAPTVTSQPTYVFARYLGYGDKGQDVLALQKFLSQQGFLLTAPTGRYGSATIGAMKKFQSAHNIKQTGGVGPATKALLNQLQTVSADAVAQPGATQPTTDATKQQKILQLQQVLQQLQSQMSALQ